MRTRGFEVKEELAHWGLAVGKVGEELAHQIAGEVGEWRVNRI